MDAIFWAGENHQLRDFYLARMRQGKRIRGNEARVRRRADGGREGGQAEREGERAWTLVRPAMRVSLRSGKANYD